MRRRTAVVGLTVIGFAIVDKMKGLEKVDSVAASYLYSSPPVLRHHDEPQLTDRRHLADHCRS